MRGRKPKLTFAIHERIVSLVRAGNYLETAAGVCGVHRTTLFRWLEKGEKQTRGKYHDLYAAVRQAQSECEARHQMVITKAAQVDWKASAWFLERVAPQRYGKQYNAGRREMVEQMLAQLEATLEPSKYADFLRRLQGGPPPSEPPKANSTVQRLLSEFSRDRDEQQAQLRAQANPDPKPEGEV